MFVNLNIKSVKFCEYECLCPNLCVLEQGMICLCECLHCVYIRKQQKQLRILITMTTTTPVSEAKAKAEKK